MSLSQPKYKYPIEDQNDYKARVYFTTIIEEPPTIDPSAFENEGNYIGFGSGIVDGQGAVAIGYSMIKGNKSLNLSTSYHNLMKNPAISTGISWRF